MRIVNLGENVGNLSGFYGTYEPLAKRLPKRHRKGRVKHVVGNWQVCCNAEGKERTCNWVKGKCKSCDCFRATHLGCKVMSSVREGALTLDFRTLARMDNRRNWMRSAIPGGPKQGS